MHFGFSETMRLLKLATLVFTLFASQTARAQETVFDVPSPDVLDKAKVYGELDGTVRPVNPTASRC